MIYKRKFNYIKCWKYWKIQLGRYDYGGLVIKAMMLV